MMGSSMIEKHKPNQQAALRGMAYLTLAQFGAADAAPFTSFSDNPHLDIDTPRLRMNVGLPKPPGCTFSLP